MTYRIDSDLEFLKDISSSELDPLVKILTRGKSGDIRLTEQLTEHQRYKNSHPDHHEYWDLIAEEIQRYGANTLATVFRHGKGVVYREVLTNACDKMKVNYNKASDVESIELNLLMKILTNSMTEMSAKELETVCDGIGFSPTLYTPEAVTIALQIAIKSGGFLSYKIAVIVANAVAQNLIGRGLSFAANAMLTRSVAVFVGPIGWTLSAVWLAVDIAGPAYRVTIPSVIMVAYLRRERMRVEMLEKKRKKKEKKKRKKIEMQMLNDEAE